MVDITQNGITVTITGTPANGVYMTNGAWVVGACTVTALSPTPTGSGATRRHGAMKNPTSITQQGYDGRMDNSGFEQEYNSALDVSLSLPLTLNPGDCLVVSKSGNLGFSDLDPGSAGSNAQMMEAFATIHCVASAPASPTTTFRPPYVGTLRNTFTTADIVGALPNLAAPLDPVGVGIDKYRMDNAVWLNAVQYYLTLPAEKAMNRMPPRGQQEWYPANRAPIHHALGLLSCTNHARKLEARNKLIQIGIDIWACRVAAASGGIYTNGAGYGAGFFFPVLYAGHLLGQPSILAILDDPWQSTGGAWSYGTPDAMSINVGTFWEQTSLYLSNSAYSGYPMPRGSYPDGKPLYGDARDVFTISQNDSRRDPNKIYDAIGKAATITGVGLDDALGWGDYFHLSCAAFIGGFIAARIMGLDLYYPLAAREFGYRFLADNTLWRGPPSVAGDTYLEDVYGYGGFGNGFNRAMWLAYGSMGAYVGPPPVPPTVNVATTTLRVTKV